MAKKSTKSPITNDLFRFFEELSQNNDREWFAEHKPRFESDVQQPTLELIDQLSGPMKRIAPMLKVVAKKSGGSLMRIYRDTRFSKDKTPYKTNVGISLRHEADSDIHAPGVYVHLAADECFVGAGCSRPERKTLAAIRAAIDQSPRDWKKSRNSKTFCEHFELAGESLKTSPRDYPKDHPMIEDLRRVDFIGISPLSREQITSPGLVDLLTTRIKTARPLMRFLCDAIDVPY